MSDFHQNVVPTFARLTDEDFDAYLRPRDQAIAARHAKMFPGIELFSVEEVFGSWKEAKQKHFEAGGFFDSIYKLESRA